jgi:hypothetical protein
MNERIRQLSEQAANEYLLEMEPVTDTLSTAKRDELAQKAKQAGIGIIPHGFSEKFAELLVRECAVYCEGHILPKGMAEEHGVNYNDGVMDCAIGLLQHFGVEK